MPYLDPGLLSVDDVAQFIRQAKLLAADYFDYASTSVETDREGPLWASGVRWVAVYMVQGGSEGWYVHVDRIKAGKNGARTADAVLIGKYWQPEPALLAVSVLTRFIYGLYKDTADLAAEAQAG